MNKLLRYVSIILLACGAICSDAQTLSLKANYLLGKESNNIYFIPNGYDISNRVFHDDYKDIVHVNSKVSFLEVKYSTPKLSFKQIKLYPLYLVGYSKDLFIFNVSYLNPPMVYDFSERSLLNGLLIGGAFHFKKIKDYNFFIEAGFSHKHYSKKIKNFDFVSNSEFINQEVHIVSKNEDNIGSVVRAGVDLKLNEKNGFSFGLTRIASNRNKVNYWYDRTTQGGGASGEGENTGYWYHSKRYKFWYFNIGYQYNIVLKKK